jgi:hypothetical protein
MRIIKLLFSGIGLLYLIGWIKYLIPAHPKDKTIIEYQNRLDYLNRILRRLKEIGDNYYENKEIPIGYIKLKTTDPSFPKKYWKVLSEHIEYTISKYNKIGRFSVNVWKIGPAGLNMPGYPGLIISHDVFWNEDLAFVLDIFLHEAYHDFYIGHGPDVGNLYGKWELNIPLRPNLIPPNELFYIYICGAFMGYYYFLASHFEDKKSLWSSIIQEKAGT